MSSQRDQAGALLLDLDGVLRVFDPEVAASVERRHGLPAGSLVRSALSWHRLRPAIAGEETHAAWLESIVADLADAAGGPKQAWAAVEEWQQHRGEVVPVVLDFVREMRAAGVPVALATNATSILDSDLDLLGLTGEFDVVVNSSVIGWAKPSREFFSAACLAVRTPASRCFSSTMTTGTSAERGWRAFRRTAGTGRKISPTCARLSASEGARSRTQSSTADIPPNRAISSTRERTLSFR